MLPAKFTPPVTMSWCAKPSPDELLQQRDLVSATQFVCDQLRSADRINCAARPGPAMNGRWPQCRHGRALPMQHAAKSSRVVVGCSRDGETARLRALARPRAKRGDAPFATTIARDPGLTLALRLSTATEAAWTGVSGAWANPAVVSVLPVRSPVKV
jgi:hypothetical protein